MTKITGKDLLSLVDLFDRSEWAVIHLETDEGEIFLSKDPERRYRGEMAKQNLPLTEKVTAAKEVPEQAVITTKAGESEPSVVRPEEPVEEDHLVIVRAPSLGTFYRAPKPGAELYVDIGDSVQADNELCLLEVMKLFTTVHAGVKGVIRKIYANDGDLVEHNQPLFAIESNE